MHIISSLLAVALYGAACLLARRHLGAGADADGSWAPAVAAAGLAATAHGVALYGAVLGSAQLALGVSEAASLVSWLAVLALLLGPLGRTLKDLGLAVMPLAALAVLLALLWPARGPLPTQGGLGTQVHVILSIIAAALLLLAACQAVFMALAEARIAAKRPLGPVGVLPALQVREALLFRTLWIGFFALSLSLVSGVMFVDDLLGQHLAHKTALSVAAWLVFAVLLWGRARHGWRARTATRWTLGGFALLGLAYFGTRVILELVLERSWHG